MLNKTMVRKKQHQYLAPNLASTLSSRGGIVREFFNICPQLGDPQIFLSLAVPANPKFLFPGSHGLIDNLASGVGLTPEEANNSAVAEAVERYCAAYIRPDRTILSDWRSLQGTALHPSELPLFTPEQYSQLNFPYAPFQEDTPVAWVEGYSLTHGTSTWVPATLVWDSYLPLHEGEKNICFGLMTGSASGATWEQAVLGGLLEIIERDSFMISWYNQLAMPKLDVKSSNLPFLEAFAPLLDEDRFELHVMDTTTDLGVPSVFGIMKTIDGRVSIGGSARLSMEDAIKKTLYEISQLYIGNKDVIYQKATKSLLPEDVTEYATRLFYYTQEYAYEELAFTHSSSHVKPISRDNSLQADNDRTRLDNLVDRLSQKKMNVIVVDLTTEDVRELGLSVVKVIVPGAVELPRSEKERIVTSDRIYSVPVKLGYLKSPKSTEELNTSPHPFP